MTSAEIHVYNLGVEMARLGWSPDVVEDVAAGTVTLLVPELAQAAVRRLGPIRATAMLNQGYADGRAEQRG